MYSWMSPTYVEDEEEYNISKYLLLQFINSSSVLNACNGNKNLIQKFVHFVKNHVLVHNQLCLYYVGIYMCHYYVAYSLNHEESIKYFFNHKADIPHLYIFIYLHFKGTKPWIENSQLSNDSNNQLGYFFKCIKCTKWSEGSRNRRKNIWITIILTSIGPIIQPHLILLSWQRASFQANTHVGNSVMYDWLERTNLKLISMKV